MLWTFASAVAGRALTFLAAVLVSRFSDPAEFATYSFLVVTLTYLAPIACFGAGPRLTVLIASGSDSETNARAVGGELALAAASTIVVPLGLTAYVLGSSGHYAVLAREGLLVLASFGLVAMTAATLAQATLAGQHNFRALFWTSSIAGLVFVVLSPPLASHFGAVGASLGFVAQFLAVLIVAAVALRSNPVMRISAPSPSFADVVRAARANSALLLATIANAGATTFAMNAAAADVNSFGSIYVGLQWKNLVLFFPTAFGQYFLPRFARLSTPKSKRELIRRGLMVNAISSILLVFAIWCGLDLISGLYGRGVAVNYLLVVLLCLSAVINAASNLISKVAIVDLATRDYLTPELGWAMTLVVATLALSQYCGEATFGYAQLIAAIAQIGFQAWILRRTQI